MVVVEMPLAGAARLMALYHVKHPQRARKGITKVVQDANQLDQKQAGQLLEALAFEIKDLRGDEPSRASPFAIISDTVPLHVTIDPDKIKAS